MTFRISSLVNLRTAWTSWSPAGNELYPFMFTPSSSCICVRMFCALLCSMACIYLIWKLLRLISSYRSMLRLFTGLCASVTLEPPGVPYLYWIELIGWLLKLFLSWVDSLRLELLGIRPLWITGFVWPTESRFWMVILLRLWDILILPTDWQLLTQIFND